MSVSSWQTETKFNRRDALVALAVALLAAVTALLVTGVCLLCR